MQATDVGPELPDDADALNSVMLTVWDALTEVTEASANKEIPIAAAVKTLRDEPIKFIDLLP